MFSRKCLRLSDVDLLRDLDGIVYFDAEVANGALDLGMSKQELDRAQRVGAELGWIKPNTGDPLVNEASALPRREAI